MTKLDVFNAKTSELVAFYNANTTGSPVKRFATRAAAEKRVMALIDAPAQKVTPIVEEELADVDTATEEIAEEETTAKISGAVKLADGSEWNSQLAASIHESWKVPEFDVKRRQRSAVVVDGNEFPSVRQAFIELDLPLSKHIKFRMTLKKETTLEEFGMTWEIVPLNYK